MDSESGEESNDWVYCDPVDLKVGAPFCELFAVSSKMVADVAEDMRLNGFRAAYPIVVWRTGNVIVDGHTRRKAALDAGVKDVPVCYMDFDSEDDAVVFAIKSQVKRRNLTEPELLRSVQELDKRRPKGGDRHSEKFKASISSRDGIEVRASHSGSAAETGSILGISASKVERARSVLSVPEVKEKVLSGEIKTINAGSKEAREKKHEKKEATKTETKPKKSEYKLNGRSVDYTLPEPEPSPPLPEIVRTAEDEEYVRSFPLRGKVVECRFDDDAILYRELGGLLREIKSRLPELVGVRSPSGRSLFHDVLHRLVAVLPVEQWRLCARCKGEGVTCNKCHKGGYTIFDFD